MTIRVFRALLLALGLLLTAGAMAPQAEGHANLLGTSPANDQVIAESPAEIRLRFDEPVERALASVTVFDGEAQRVSLGRLAVENDREVVVPVPDALSRGTFTVVWRSVSVDGHAINGYFVFHVGLRGANPAGVIGDVGSGEPSRAIEATDTVTRFLNLVLTLVVIGGVVTGVAVIRGRSSGVERGIWTVVAYVAGVLALVGAWSVVVQAAKGSGTSVASALDGELLKAVLSSQYGRARSAEVASALLVLLFALLVARTRARPAAVGSVVAAVLLSFTHGAAGHAGARGVTAVLADGVHVMAASTWAGGLAMTCLAILLARRDRSILARNALTVFSGIALVAVAALILSGAVSGLIELGGVSHLWSTSYGRLILVKILIVGGLVGLAVVSRRRVRRGHDPGALIGRAIVVELGLMLVAVGVTTQLIAQPPARVAVRLGESQHTATMHLDDLDARVTVVPVAAGPNTVTILLMRDGRSVDVDEVRVAATNRERGLGPIRAPAPRTQPGTYVAASMPLMGSGDWDLTVSVRRGEFDQWEDAVRVTLR